MLVHTLDKRRNPHQIWIHKLLWTCAKCYFWHPWHACHHDVIPGKAQGGHMGTFTMLFRMVKGLYHAIFSFLLIFSDLGQKMTWYYWTMWQQWALERRPNQLRCRLGYGLGRARAPYIRWGHWSPHGKWQFGCTFRGTACIVSFSTCHTATGTDMPYGITQCYLPPGRGDIPAFIPAEAGTRLSDPGEMQGWVDLVGWLHIEMIYPPRDGHPSRY